MESILDPFTLKHKIDKDKTIVFETPIVLPIQSYTEQMKTKSELTISIPSPRLLRALKSFYISVVDQVNEIVNDLWELK